MSEREKLAERIAATGCILEHDPGAGSIRKTNRVRLDVSRAERDLIVAALRSAQDLPSEEEIARLRKQFELALDGHTKYSRDCCVSGEYLTDQVWPLVLSLLRTRSPSDEGWRPIETLHRIDTQVVLWSPCDGVHLLPITISLHELDNLRRGGVFTHWRHLDGPTPPSDEGKTQKDE